MNHVIRVHDPVVTDFCDALCYTEHNCASYNLRKRDEAEGHRCELNNATHEGNENDMEENPDYEYRGTKVTVKLKKLSFKKKKTCNLFLSSLSINLVAFYHECRSLIGYATHQFFCDR